MSIPPSLFGPDIPGFKKEIGYEELKNSISDSEIVILDWPKELETFAMDSGDWKEDSLPLVSTAHEDYNAEIFASLMQGETAVNITVNVISSSNLDALKLPFEAMTRFSASYIAMRRLSDGPGDLYLTDLVDMKQTNGNLVFKNIYVDISTMADINVREFADYLYQIMSKAVIQRTAYQIPEFRVDISASTIKLGDEFTVTLNAISKDSADWNVEMRNGNWPMDDLEVVTYGPNHHTFKALKPGPLEINFDIFNTKTLMSYLKKVHINILE